MGFPGRLADERAMKKIMKQYPVLTEHLEIGKIKYYLECRFKDIQAEGKDLSHSWPEDGCMIKDMRLAGASFESMHMAQNKEKALNVDAVRFGLGRATQAEYEDHMATLRQELFGQKQVSWVSGWHTADRVSERGR